MAKVKVDEADIIEVIREADNKTLWGDKAWKARNRLLSAVGTDAFRDGWITSDN